MCAGFQPGLLCEGEKQTVWRILPALYITIIGLMLPISGLPAVAARTAEEKTPIIHSTDLMHPHDDPDDHYDLACLFAIEEFDIKGIVLDGGREPLGQVKRCGRPAVEQMMHITGRKVPYAIGLSRKLRSPDDDGLDQPRKFQAGIELILSALGESDEPVVYHAAGSLRNLAAALNRRPELRRKLKAVYIEIGRGPGGVQREWNVMLDPRAFARVIVADLPLYWCPCSGKDGYRTYYQADQSAVVGACAPPVQNYFVYCLRKTNADPIAFLRGGPHPLPTGRRNIWCTAPLLHAAGRKIYRRGPGDYVALPPAEAEKAGLAERHVEAFRFVPMRAALRRPAEQPAEGNNPSRPVVETQLNPAEGATGFIFRSTGPEYRKIMPSVLKNLLAGLGE